MQFNFYFKITWPPHHTTTNTTTNIKISEPAPSKIFSEIFNPPPFTLFPKLECGACPKSSNKTKSLTRKPCPVGLSPIIICQEVSPLLPKMSQNSCPSLGVDCFPFPWTFIGNPGDGEKSYPTTKNLPSSLIRKIPLNRFKFFAVKSFISSPSNSNFQVIILCNLHL